MKNSKKLPMWVTTFLSISSVTLLLLFCFIVCVFIKKGFSWLTILFKIEPTLLLFLLLIVEAVVLAIITITLIIVSIRSNLKEKRFKYENGENKNGK